MFQSIRSVLQLTSQLVGASQPFVSVSLWVVNELPERVQQRWYGAIDIHFLLGVQYSL